MQRFFVAWWNPPRKESSFHVEVYRREEDPRPRYRTDQASIEIILEEKVYVVFGQPRHKRWRDLQ